MKVISFALITALVFITSVKANAQSLIIQTNIHLPADSITKKQLINSLNNFLSLKEKPAKDNPFILPDDILETAVLLDELKGAEKNPLLKNDNFYKPYLTNVVETDADHFSIQFAYLGMADGAPVLHSAFTLLAKRVGDKFCFYSPLRQNTSVWKTRKLSNITYHYKDTLNLADARAYLKTLTYYDQKLKTPAYPITVYYCNNLLEVLKLIGIDYKAGYNGIKQNNLSVNINNNSLVVNGWNSEKHRFDPHDLWHERLRVAISSDIINRPVDEGCAYLYGGSWGLTWDEILAKFKKYAADNPNADWLKLYTDATDFAPGPKILRISYALNALIARKLEKEKGFAPVLELLSCGKKEQGDANYFNALQKVSGITKATFNQEMAKLIAQ